MKSRFIIFITITAFFTNTLYAQTVGQLYGLMPYEPSSSGDGGVFYYDPLTRTDSSVLAFNNATGQVPYGSLIQAFNAKLYGMTSQGGTNGLGAIFSIDPVTGKYSTLYSFDSTHGFEPHGTLFQANDSVLYGVTLKGGTAGHGVIFSFNPVTMTYNALHSFNDTDGAAPYGSLIQASNGILYGMTNLGGKYNTGVIFSYDMVLKKYTPLVNLTYPNGTNPYGGFIQANDGLLYGMTYTGGKINQGAIIRFNPVTDSDSVVYNFNVSNGANPYGNLLQSSNGYLYGMTSYSKGANGRGEIFRFNALTDSLSILVIFTDTLPQFGYSPQGSLIQTCNGSLYGMTTLGGGADFGTIFRYDTNTTEDSVLVSLTAANGIRPTGDLLEVMIANVITGNNPCYGDSSGWAVIHVRGGHYPLTYIWSTGASADSIAGLKAGSYNATVRDAKGIYYTFNFNITQPSKLNEVITVLHNVSCNGADNGKIVLAATGGVKPYQYLWSPVSGTTDSLINLGPGTYSCQVTDSNHCVSATGINITEPPVLHDSTISITNVKCYGSNTGSVSVGVTGGTKPYVYNWSNGETNAKAVNLFAGVYTCTVIDSNGCITYDTATITSPTQIIASTSYTATPCSKNSGSASVSASGGMGAYTYSWQPGGAITSTDTALVAGSYTCTITDSNSCSITASVYVPNIGGPHDSIVSVKNVTCYGDSNGGARGGVSGGSPPYTYSWFPAGGGSDTAGNLSAGTYTFTATDNTGCIGTATLTIKQPAKLVDSIVTYSNVTCYDSTNGKAKIGVRGGTSPYAYVWSGLTATAASVTLIPAGTYTVWVKDSNKCIDSTFLTIASPSQINLTANSTANKCGLNNGTAMVSVTGGTVPYSYLWSPIAGTNSSISNIKGGNYMCTVTDSFKCIASINVAVHDTGGPRDTINLISNVGPCYGDKNGAAIVKMLTASGKYSFSWAPITDTNNVAFNLPAGMYTCTIIDTTGCTGVDSITITQPAKLVPLIQTVGICFNSSSNDGYAKITVTGGYSPYTYSWSNSATTAAINNLSTGSYFCTVTDTAGCSAIKSCNVLKGNPLKIDSIVTHTTSCSSCTDGWIKVVVSGGVPPEDTLGYTYFWTSSSSYTTTDTITVDSNLAAGTYTLTISTSCTSTYDSGTVIVSVPLVSADKNAIYIYPVPSTGIIYAVLPQMHNARLDVIDEVGLPVYTRHINAIKPGTTIDINLMDLPDGIYIARFTSDEGIVTRKIILQK